MFMDKLINNFMKSFKVGEEIPYWKATILSILIICGKLNVEQNGKKIDWRELE